MHSFVYSKYPCIVPVAFYSAFEIGSHRWEHSVVAVCRLVPVAAIMQVLAGGTHRHCIGTTNVYMPLPSCTAPGDPTRATPPLLHPNVISCLGARPSARARACRISCSSHAALYFMLARPVLICLLAMYTRCVICACCVRSAVRSAVDWLWLLTPAIGSGCCSGCSLWLFAVFRQRGVLG